MSDIVERLLSGTPGADSTYPAIMTEAAKTIESLRAEIARLNMDIDRLTRTNQAKREHRDKLLAAKMKDAAEIERLRAEVKVWQGHTKTAVWSDSEECKMLAADNERLRAALRDIHASAKDNHLIANLARAALGERT